MKNYLLLLSLIPFLLTVGCTTSREQHAASHSRVGTKMHVRTTAYTHTEAGGRKNAIGGRLSYGKVKSAAADWSRFPIGTTFKLLNTGEIYKIDDYGSALVGTNTIDLYKTSRTSMRRWGVRHVDIEILEWGCSRTSLKILEPRTRNKHVRVMVASLNQKS